MTKKWVNALDMLNSIPVCDEPGSPTVGGVLVHGAICQTCLSAGIDLDKPKTLARFRRAIDVVLNKQSPKPLIENVDSAVLEHIDEIIVEFLRK